MYILITLKKVYFLRRTFSKIELSNRYFKLCVMIPVAVSYTLERVAINIKTSLKLFFDTNLLLSNISLSYSFDFWNSDF